jgi:hypothetical protein
VPAVRYYVSGYALVFAVVATHRTVITRSCHVMHVCFGRREGAMLVGIDYSGKVPSVIRGMQCVVGYVGFTFLQLNGTKLKTAQHLSFPRNCASPAYLHDIAALSPYTNPTILSYVSGRTSPSVNMFCCLCIVLPSLAAICKAI